MGRPVTLFTGQWADVPLEAMARKAKAWGYDGLELACWGQHVDVVKAASDAAYSAGIRRTLEAEGLSIWAIGNHLAGQLVLDPNTDGRSDAFAPAELAGDAEGKRRWAIEAIRQTAVAASKLGVHIVTGFTGSPIWHMIYPFPPVPQELIDAGYRTFAAVWGPILDHYRDLGVRFALEVHPGEIAFDLYSAKAALDAIGGHPAFGFNFDPSHLLWQGVDPVQFLYAFPDRIFHVHVKDAEVTLDGRSGILASHLPFGDRRRGWDFRSPGRGKVDFRAIVRALNQIGYDGPLSVEWEDNTMDREFGAAEAGRFVRELDAPRPTRVSFEESMKR